MTKTETFDALGKQCSVKEMNGALAAGKWCVSGRYACSHMIGFDKENKLSFVSKDLGSAENPPAADLLADFISAIGAASADAPSSFGETRHAISATVVTTTFMAKDPDSKRDMVMKEVSIKVGQKTVRLQVNRPVGGGQINVVGMAVTETLSQQ